MIIVRFTSGLGNQMFQYNLYSYLRSKYPETKVLADVTWFYTDNEHHGFELRRIFDNVEGSKFTLEEASAADIFRVTGQLPAFRLGRFARAVRRLTSPVNRILRMTKMSEGRGIRFDALEDGIDHDTVCDLDPKSDYYIFGFFIEEAYYRDRIEEIRSELMFPPLTDANKEIAGKMESQNSVSVHVRRGDYLSATYAGRFLTLDDEYYRPAVDTIRQHLDNPVFYIFSEDADYVSKAFSWLSPKEIVNINSGNDSFRDMQLMTKCKANIIANSTFSQWASILNENPGHITVYPARYMAGEDTEERTMPGWIRV